MDFPKFSINTFKRTQVYGRFRNASIANTVSYQTLLKFSRQNAAKCSYLAVILQNQTTTFQISQAASIYSISLYVKLLVSKRKETIIVRTVKSFKAKLKES